MMYIILISIFLSLNLVFKYIQNVNCTLKLEQQIKIDNKKDQF